MIDNQLSRAERLRGRRAIDTLFDSGKSGFAYPFRYVYLPLDQPDTPTAVLFAVPKKNHKRAHVRNLLKRRTREAYRLNKSATGLHIALIYSAKEVEAFNTIQDAVRKILATIATEL